MVIEDAAQAHGALQDPGRSAATAYSFYPTKNLGGIGDGGAVVTSEHDLEARVRTLRVHGMTDQYVHESVSQNFRMSEVEAAWLRLALVDLATDVAQRRAIVGGYRQAAPGLCWQTADANHAYHLAVFRSADRKALALRWSVMASPQRFTIRWPSPSSRHTAICRTRRVHRPRAGLLSASACHAFRR